MMKLNNLGEQTLIRKLYEASQAGVRIQLADTAAATRIDATSENPSFDSLSPTPIPPGALRSQDAIYRYLAEKRGNATGSPGAPA